MEEPVLLGLILSMIFRDFLANNLIFAAKMY